MISLRSFALPFTLSFTLSLTLPFPVFARDPSPSPRADRAHYQRGLQHYRAGRYAPALEEFRAAYTIDPQPEYLYSWAQAARQSGDCETARPLYQKFLESDRTGEYAEVVRTNLARCKPTPPPAPPPQPITPPAPRRNTWYKDPAGGALTGVGLGVLALGIGFFVGSQSIEDSIASAPDYQTHAARFDRAQTYRSVGISGLALGSALIVAGASVWAWRGVKNRKQIEAAVSVDARSLGITFAGRF